jgi:hypothetical protein
MLALDAKVERGQAVLLVNAITEEERECRVVYIQSKLWRKRIIGVEFIKPRRLLACLPFFDSSE